MNYGFFWPAIKPTGESIVKQVFSPKMTAVDWLIRRNVYFCEG